MVEKVDVVEKGEQDEQDEQDETADEVAARYGLRPLPVEGGRFRQTWAGPPDAAGRPAGTAILVLLTTAPGDFSALHRLPTDEVWHFYEGDALELLLLAPDGTDRLAVLGQAGCVQLVVPAGPGWGRAWHPARPTADGGGTGGHCSVRRWRRGSCPRTTKAGTRRSWPRGIRGGHGSSGSCAGRGSRCGWGEKGRRVSSVRDGVEGGARRCVTG